MDQDERELALRRIRDQIDERKADICLLYSELKLKLPLYLKSLTISQLREAGGRFDEKVILPKNACDVLRAKYDVKGKKENLQEKLEETRKQNRNRIIAYYNDSRREMGKTLLEKKMGDLSEEEWYLLGFDIQGSKKIVAGNAKSLRKRN